MALDPALERLIQTKLAHTRKPQWELPITEARQAFRNLWTPAMTGDPVTLSRIEDRAVPAPDRSIQLRVYAPENEALPVILYFPGGGYVKGGIEDADAFCRRLARSSRHVVLSIGYR